MLRCRLRSGLNVGLATPAARARQTPCLPAPGWADSEREALMDVGALVMKAFLIAVQVVTSYDLRKTGP